MKKGPATGGTAVTITGTDFRSATGVSFAGVPATSFKVVNIVTIEAVAPPGVAGPADVQVTNVGGTSAPTKKDQFRYAPEIEGVSPANGPEAGGNTVTITGVGFVVGHRHREIQVRQSRLEIGPVLELDDLHGARAGRQSARHGRHPGARQQRQEHRGRGRPLHLRIGRRRAQPV